jgi:hypothetical protein
MILDIAAELVAYGGTRFEKPYLAWVFSRQRSLAVGKLMLDGAWTG